MVGPERADGAPAPHQSRSASRWLRDAIAAHFGRTPRAGDGPLEGLEILDIGCGAGLLSEPLSRLGAARHRARSGADARSKSRAPMPRRPAPS